MEQNLVVWTENESKQTEQNLFNDPANEQLMAMLYSGAGNVLDVMLEFKQLMFAASAAMKIVKTKLEILDTEFQMTHNRDPIHMIQTRLKTQASIMEKLTRKGLEPTTANMEAYVSDIAGVRVICRYMDDIYTVEQLLMQHDDISLLERKDYISTPKASGYRSLHLIVQVPVFLPDGVRNTKVEIQLRTIAMDFWASLEHEIRYKKGQQDQTELLSRLEACAEVIARTDVEMQAIRMQSDQMHKPDAQKDVLLEKLRRMEVSLK